MRCLRLLWSTSHPRRPCLVHLRQWWSLRASSGFIACASGGEYCTRARSASSANASGGVYGTAPTPVVDFLAPAPAVIVAPVEKYISPVPLIHTTPAPVMECIAPSAHTHFFSLSLSLQRLQMQRHTSRLSLAPRVERASRLRHVLCRDAVLCTRRGTCLTCRWSGSCVFPWRAWGTNGDFATPQS